MCLPSGLSSVEINNSCEAVSWTNSVSDSPLLLEPPHCGRAADSSSAYYACPVPASKASTPNEIKPSLSACPEKDHLISEYLASSK